MRASEETLKRKKAATAKMLAALDVRTDITDAKFAAMVGIGLPQLYSWRNGGVPLSSEADMDEARHTLEQGGALPRMGRGTIEEGTNVIFPPARRQSAAVGDLEALAAMVLESCSDDQLMQELHRRLAR